MSNKKQHGGPGRGQGRHLKPDGEKYLPFGLRLPPEVHKWLMNNIEKKKRSKFIVSAIEEKIDNSGEKDVTETH